MYDFSSKPSAAWITVNRDCNFRCKWCYARDTGYTKDRVMSFNMACRLADIIKDLGIDNVMLIGGEPSMWSGLFDFNDYCKEIGLSSTIITNAHLFGNDSYWEQYTMHPCDYAVASVKGVTDKQLKQIAGISSADQTLVGIQRAIAFHPQSGIETVCSTMSSVEDLISIAKYSKAIGSKTFLVSACNVTLEGDLATTEYVMDDKLYMQTIIDSHPYLDKLFNEGLQYHISLPYCLWPKEFVERLISKNQLSGPCNVFDRSGIVFDYNGDILFCNSIYDTVIARFGVDFDSASQILDSLNSEEMKAYYSEILRFPADACTDCSINDMCRGGCIVNWMVMDPHICNSI